MRVVSLVTIVVLAGCGSSSSPSGSSGSSSGAPPGDGGSLADTGAVDGGASCSTLVAPETGQVAPQKNTGTMPVPSGGALADGTYVLTQDDVYSSGFGAGSSASQVLRITGNKLEDALYAGEPRVHSTTVYTATTTGTTLHRACVCAQGPFACRDDSTSTSPPLEYSLQGGTLMLFGGQEVQTYVRQ